MAGLETWSCKLCFVEKSSRQLLWTHMKTKHSMHASVKPVPCLFTDCSFVFRSMSSLSGHMSRNHNNDCTVADQHTALKCCHCLVLNYSIPSYLCHLRAHVRRNATVVCPVKDCFFSTNIIGTFRSHFSKKHGSLQFEFIKEDCKCSIQQNAQASVMECDDVTCLMAMMNCLTQ